MYMAIYKNIFYIHMRFGVDQFKIKELEWEVLILSVFAGALGGLQSMLEYTAHVKWSPARFKECNYLKTQL